MTEEMQAIRDTTLKCGYCGAMYSQYTENTLPSNGFCSSCLGSVYLKESDLYLLRLMPVSHEDSRPPITEAEKADLMPIYIDRQTKDRTSAAVQHRIKARERVIAEYLHKSSEAQVKKDGLLWLFDHNVSMSVIENCIYYGSDKGFCFGWRSPIEPAVKSAILDIISEFPFNYYFEEGKKY